MEIVQATWKPIVSCLLHKIAIWLSIKCFLKTVAKWLKVLFMTTTDLLNLITLWEFLRAKFRLLILPHVGSRGLVSLRCSILPTSQSRTQRLALSPMLKRSLSLQSKSSQKYISIKDKLIAQSSPKKKRTNKEIDNGFDTLEKRKSHKKL